MKRLFLIVFCGALLFGISGVVLAADAVMKKENQEIVNAEAKPVSEKAAPVMVSVDLDSRIANLTKQREQLAQAGQKNLSEKQELDARFAAVTGALITLQEMKREAQPAKEEIKK